MDTEMANAWTYEHDMGELRFRTGGYENRLGQAYCSLLEAIALVDGSQVWIKALGRDEMQDVSIDIGDEKGRHVAFSGNILAISTAFSIHLYEINKTSILTAQFISKTQHPVAIRGLAWNPIAKPPLLLVHGDTEALLYQFTSVLELLNMKFNSPVKKRLSSVCWSKSGEKLLIAAGGELRSFSWSTTAEIKTTVEPEIETCLCADDFQHKSSFEFRGSICAIESISNDVFVVTTEASTFPMKENAPEPIIQTTDQGIIDLRGSFSSTPSVSCLEILTKDCQKQIESHTKVHQQCAQLHVFQGAKLQQSIGVDGMLSPNIIAVRDNRIAVSSSSCGIIQLYQLDGTHLDHLTQFKAPDRSVVKGLRLTQAFHLYAIFATREQEATGFYGLQQANFKTFLVHTQLEINAAQEKEKDVRQLVVDLQSHIDRRFDAIELMIQQLTDRIST